MLSLTRLEGILFCNLSAQKLIQSAWMEHYPAIIGIVGMGQEQIVGSFNWREVDGVTTLELVFTGKQAGIAFTGILSDKAEYNPDFYNWNRIKLRYCDGASFSGDSENQGQRIWLAAMEEFMSKGMRSAKQALLSGCSAGGLASVLHCDELRGLFSGNTKVKCRSDAGMFLDAYRLSLDALLVPGQKNTLPLVCTDHLDPTSCFFPQNLVANIQTPLFILNTAYSWQIQSSLAPTSADPSDYYCRLNHTKCSPAQIQFLQGFRNEMLNAINGFSLSKQNGLFINSSFAHCQTERQDTWFADNSPVIGNKKMLETGILTKQALKPSTVLILVTRVATIWFSDKPSSTDWFIHMIPY